MSSGKTEQAVFFGSGPVAARSLELLLRHTSIEAVITKPRAAHHKGLVPVLDAATKHNIPVYTAANKLELDELLSKQTFASRYAILIDFGIIVSPRVINSFEIGIINSHFSLLPHLRGADPITWAIANGDKTTGVSLMMVDEGLDTGKLLTYRTHHLSGNETTQQLTDSLISLSDTLLQEFIPRYLTGELKPKAQPHPDRATYSRKLTKQDSLINWCLPAKQIERNIRAFTGWPGSKCTLGNIEVIITSAIVVPGQGAPGEYIIDGKQLIVYTGSSALSITSLKPAGKKDMPIVAFLAGYRNLL
jgi:methionyl-tRNA formyltransferase